MALRGAFTAAARGVLHALPRPMRDAVRARVALAKAGTWRANAYRRRLADRLRAHAARPAEPSFFFLPTHSWHQASFQRPQQLARALGEIGCPVLFAERLLHHAWSTVDEADRMRRLEPEEVSPGVLLWRCPQEYLRWLVRRVDPTAVVGYSALEQPPWLPPEMLPRLVYDVIDHDRVLDPRGDPRWPAQHGAWVDGAAVVVGTADDIVARLRARRPSALLVPNGVRVEDWADGARQPVPDDLAPARRAPVVVYYHGILGDPWFDWPLWSACAAARPDWAFVLVGWPRGETLEALRARVARLPNVHYLGPKPYGALASYLGHCDVATIPFLVNEGTHAASAIKVFEYMAAGKPIVAPPLREISKYESVVTAAGPRGFVEALERALALARDPAYRATLRREAEANTWVERARRVRDAVVAARAAGTGRG